MRLRVDWPMLNNTTQRLANTRLTFKFASNVTGTKKALRMSSASTTSPDTTPYQLQFYVPKSNTAAVLSAVHKTGAGTYPGGIYGECAFITSGTGTFRPLTGANPAIGKVGDVEEVEEDRVEVMCLGKESTIAAVKALKTAHPYEQVAYFVLKGEEI